MPNKIELMSNLKDSASGIIADETDIIIESLITNEVFYALVLIAVVTTLFTTQSWLIRDLVYKNYFKNPFRAFAVEVVAFITDILMATSLIYYIQVARHPAPGAEAEWYTAIYALWFAIQGLKYMWSIMFWRFGTFTLGMGFAVGWALLITVGTLVLTILFGVREVWPSFALTGIVFFVYALTFIFNSYVLWQQMNGWKGYNNNTKTENKMMESRQTMGQPQQQQQQQTQQTQQKQLQQQQQTTNRNLQLQQQQRSWK